MTEQLELIKKQSRYKIILSTLFNTSVGSLSFLLAMLMASVIALVILFSFFNVMLFIITILIIVIMFLSVLSGSTIKNSRSAWMGRSAARRRPRRHP